MNNQFQLYFDGGTPCNIPRLGYGVAYGSFLLLNGVNTLCDVRKQQYELGSNNFAEAKTCRLGLEKCVELGITDLEVYGDSNIVISRLNYMMKRKHKSHKSKSSSLFIQEVDNIYLLTKSFQSIKATWLPRASIFKIFGH